MEDVKLLDQDEQPLPILRMAVLVLFLGLCVIIFVITVSIISL